MKKFLSTLLALALACATCFAFVACDDGNGNGGGGGGTGGGGGSSSVTNIYDNSPHKDKWDRNDYGSWVYDVWDSTVLPSYFPSQPAGEMKELETTYEAATDKMLGSTFRVGSIDVDEQVENYGVHFQGTMAQVESIKAEMEQKGFLVHTVSDYDWQTGEEELERYDCYSKDNFVCISVNERYGVSDGETCPYTVSITAVGKIFDYPDTFAGLPMPLGYLTQEAGYSQVEGEDYDYVDYPLSIAPTAEYWGIYEMSFMGISLTQYQNYVTQVTGAGYTVTSSSTPTGSENVYRANLNNGTNYLILTFYADDSYVVLGFSNYSGWWG